VDGSHPIGKNFLLAKGSSETRWRGSAGKRPSTGIECGAGGSRVSRLYSDARKCRACKDAGRC
jgi:hypothetical protein